MTHRTLAAALLLVFCSAAFAQDVEKITAGDIDAFLKCENARALSDARLMYARTKEERSKVAQTRLDAIKAAGLTEDRYIAIGSFITTIAQALADLERGGDDAANAKETLKDVDKASVELIKARLKEINDSAGRAEAARKQAKDDHDAEVRGPAPDPAKLAGIWQLDIDATINAMGMGGDAEIAKKLREDLGKRPLGYKFGPGDAIEATSTLADGNPRSDKGTYRLEGNTLYVKSEGSKREQKLMVGMKGDALIFTMFGMPMYFKKQ